jgi:hypothetical protein
VSNASITRLKHGFPDVNEIPLQAQAIAEKGYEEFSYMGDVCMPVLIPHNLCMNQY